MELGVAVDDGDLAVATLDGDRGQRSELGSTTLSRRLVRVIGFREGLLNRLCNPRAHRTLAIAAVDDHLESTVERQFHQVSAHELHLSYSTDMTPDHEQQRQHQDQREHNEPSRDLLAII